MSRPVFSRLYPRMSKGMEQAGMAEHRRTLLAGLTGEVVEIGAGDGANFIHCPPTVTRVLAVEPEPHLRHLAEAAARQAPVPRAHTSRTPNTPEPPTWAPRTPFHSPADNCSTG